MDPLPPELHPHIEPLAFRLAGEAADATLHKLGMIGQAVLDLLEAANPDLPRERLQEVAGQFVLAIAWKVAAMNEDGGIEVH